LRVNSSIDEPASAVCRVDIIATATANCSSGHLLLASTPSPSCSNTGDIVSACGHSNTGACSSGPSAPASGVSDSRWCSPVATSRAVRYDGTKRVQRGGCRATASAESAISGASQLKLCQSTSCPCRVDRPSTCGIIEPIISTAEPLM